MRRLTDDEMATLCRLARNGREGPSRAIEELWNLILREAHGLSREERPAFGEPFWTMDYSIQRDQSAELLAAMVRNRRLPPRVVRRFHLTWTVYAPSEYEPEAPASEDDPPGVEPSQQ